MLQTAQKTRKKDLGGNGRLRWIELVYIVYKLLMIFFSLTKDFICMWGQTAISSSLSLSL
jgi:hypothetical protein